MANFMENEDLNHNPKMSNEQPSKDNLPKISEDKTEPPAYTETETAAPISASTSVTDFAPTTTTSPASTSPSTTTNTITPTTATATGSATTSLERTPTIKAISPVYVANGHPHPLRQNPYQPRASSEQTWRDADARHKLQTEQMKVEVAKRESMGIGMDGAKIEGHGGHGEEQGEGNGEKGKSGWGHFGLGLCAGCAACACCVVM